MITFFADLDGTLIYSHRHPPRGPCVVAERLNGRDQAYITARMLRTLSGTDRIETVPVTTRAPQQVERLNPLMQRLGVRRILMLNGALLMEDGRIDARWREASLRLAAGARSSMARAEALLAAIVPPQRLHAYDGLLLYAASDDPARLAAELSGVVDVGQVTLFSDRRKVYCIPSALNKGAAVRRFVEREGIRFCVAAGDGPLDAPMLRAADAAILPEEIADDAPGPGRYVCPRGESFPDFICDALERILRENAQKRPEP